LALQRSQQKSVNAAVISDLVQSVVWYCETIDWLAFQSIGDCPIKNVPSTFEEQTAYVDCTNDRVMLLLLYQ
jgi:hypothetical protein